MAGVAEVDDARDALESVEEDVVEVEVAVHDVRAQMRPTRKDALLEAVDDRGDEPPAIRVCNGRKHAAQVSRVRNVPEQLPAGGRVKEAAQCDVETGKRRREIADG